MSAWVCSGCTAVYSVDAPACPQCGSTEYVEQGVEMPKITRHGGVSGVEGLVVGNADDMQAMADVLDAMPVDDYDPADYTVAEVNTYLDQCASEGNQAEYDRVLLAERADQGGKGRAGILGRVN